MPLAESTHETNEAWRFNTDQKQRVADYLRQNPGGSFDHFRIVGKRAYQITRSLYMEVWNTLQERAVLTPVAGTQAYENLKEKLRLEILEEATRPATPPLPPPSDADDLADLSPGAPKQAPLSFPNQTTTEKESPMAKPEIAVKKLTPEQRTKLDTIWMKTPQIEYEDLMKGLETFTIPKTAYWSIRFTIRNKTYTFPGVNGKKPYGSRTDKPESIKAAPAPSAPSNGHANGHTVTEKPKLFNYYKLEKGTVEVVARLNPDGYAPEDLKTIQKLIPSLLTELVDPRSTFVFIKITEDYGDQVKQILELRRTT